MNQLEMIVIDLDGTLLDDDMSISDKNKEIIKKAIQNKILVTLATGRPFKSAKYYAEELDINTPIICYNGGLIKDVYSKEILLSNNLDLDTSHKIIKFARINNAYIKLYSNDILYVEHNESKTKEFAKNYRIEYRIVDNMNKLINNLDQEPNMIVLKNSVNKTTKIKKNIDKRLNIDVSYTLSNSTSIEIMKKSTNKGKAVKILAQNLNIKIENILSIGNGLNDLEMLNFCGKGIAMKNSDIFLLKKWKKISNYNNNKDGVFHILKKHLPY